MGHFASSSSRMLHQVSRKVVSFRSRDSERSCSLGMLPFPLLPLSTPLFLNSDSRLCVVELMLKVYMGFSEISLVIHGSCRFRRKYCVSDTCEMNLSILTMYHQTNGLSFKGRKFNSSKERERKWGSGLCRCFTYCSSESWVTFTVFNIIPKKLCGFGIYLRRGSTKSIHLTFMLFVKWNNTCLNMLQERKFVWLMWTMSLPTPRKGRLWPLNLKWGREEVKLCFLLVKIIIINYLIDYFFMGLQYVQLETIFPNTK